MIFFNYRSDRMRQIVRALALPGLRGLRRARPARGSPAVTMTQYDQTFPIPPAFPPFSLARILAEVLADQGRTQFRTAETEKYPHVTYFFNGGYEPPYRGEERCLVPSQKVATYDLAPEMSAAGITDVLCRAIEARRARLRALQLRQRRHGGPHRRDARRSSRRSRRWTSVSARVLASAEKAGASVLITADHGNCEMMIDPATGGVHTAHTTNPVPLRGGRRRTRPASAGRRALRRGPDGAAASSASTSRPR